MTKGFTIWFTGLSGAGKTTVSRLVEKELRARGYKVEVLDGDVVRENLSKGLGFSKEDRDTNIRRIGFVCELLTRNDIVAIAAAISPYRAIRDENRARAGGRFIEVYCQCPIDVLAERDVKGLYKKALRGEIKNFTGVDDPYEPPLDPEVVIESDKESPEQSAAKVIAKLEELGYIPVSDAEALGLAQLRNGAWIRLSYERWGHITESHDYMGGLHEWVLETLSDPDTIVPGGGGALIAIKHFPKTPITEKDLIVIYREASPRTGIVVTAFMTSKVEKVRLKGVLWQRQ